MDISLGTDPRILTTLTTRCAQIVEMRKRLMLQVAVRKKQGIVTDVEDLEHALKAVLETQISDVEQRIKRAIASKETSATKAGLFGPYPASARFLQPY